MWGNAVKIARIYGFDIKIDASWLFIAVLIVWNLASGYFPTVLPQAQTSTYLVMAVLGMLGLFASLILHELSHAIVARRFGLKIFGITLFLFGGVAELQSEPDSGKSEFWIAIAGPVASLSIALTLWFGGQVLAFAGAPEVPTLILGYLALMNFMLAAFNLLPAFPMDGGRIFRAWLWTRSGDLLAATRQATAVSTGFSYGFMGLGIYALVQGGAALGFWPFLIGLFLLSASRTALSRLEAETALDDRRVTDLMSPDPWAAQPDQSLSDLVNRVFLRHAVSFAPVVEHGKLLGYIDIHMVQRISRENWATTTVEDVIESVSPDNSVPPDMPGLDLMARIMKTGRRKFLVTDNDHLVGVVTASDLLAFLNVSREVR